MRLALPPSHRLGSQLHLALRVEDAGAGDRPPAVLADTGVLARRLHTGETHLDLTLDVPAEALARAELPTVWAHVWPAARASAGIHPGDLITATASDPRAPGADGRLWVDLEKVP